ncbi:MAG: hypothetical protein LBN12_03945 [Clostridiales Family XIII bacterium]|jgi:hypothetical protein|nr:hypothetical protein [Clostridiales Family XIII bacterium]
MLFSREDFQGYLDCFNEKRYDDIVSYFGEDCILYYFTDWKLHPEPIKSLSGKSAFKANYISLHDTFDEDLKLGVFMSTEENLFVELYTTFRAKKDADFTAGFMKKGDLFYCNQYIDYDLHPDGKFKQIRIGQFNTIDPAKSPAFK